MARWTTPTDEQVQAYADWADGRPEPVKTLAKRFDPWSLYRLKHPDDPETLGHRVTIQAFCDDGTIIVDVTGQFNLIGFGRRVFGIDPGDLTECELPAADEPVGVTMTEEETLEYINARRAEIGVPPLTKEGLDEIKDSETPRCAIGGEGAGQEESQASAEAVPAQEAGPADDQGADKT